MNKLPLIFSIVLLAGISHSQNPLWFDDILVWDMTYNTSWLGTGYVYCTGIYDMYGNIYAVSTEDKPAPLPDMIKIYTSDDDGQTWSVGGWTEGGAWHLIDADLCLILGSTNYLIVFYTATRPGELGMYMASRYELPSFNLIDAYIVDYTNPLADTIRSQAVISHSETDIIWHFSNDISDRVFLSKSSDDGVTWSASELVAENATRPSAAAGPGGRVYLVYQETTGGNTIRCIAFSGSSTVETAVGVAAVNAAPVPAVEWQASQNVGVSYHSQAGYVMLSMSDDYGATWGAAETITEGIYPFIDIFPGSNCTSIAYIDTGQAVIRTGLSACLADLSSTGFETRTDQTPSFDGPPVIRFSPAGMIEEINALFYMGSGPQDLWYDSSVLTGIEEPPAEGLTVFGIDPNPACGRFSVSFCLETPAHSELGIYSLDGRLQESIFRGTTSGGTFSAGNDLPAGIYTVVLKSGDRLVTKRVVRL